MQRIITAPRNNWQAAVEKLGFGFHTTDVPYWDESVYYSFTMGEITNIEKATQELWEMCLGAAQHIMDNNLYVRFGIPEWVIPYIEASWQEDHPAIYGRFDFCYKNGQLKLLEFNADTPTSLYEAGIVQWFWLQDMDKSKDQFNSIHEKLIDGWKTLKEYLHPGKLHFTCLKQTLEDLTNTEYIRDCAMQAGLDTKLVFVDDLGWNENTRVFVDMEEEPITNMFKLYPWEWMVREDFGRHIPEDNNRTFWIEPGWKMLLSNKALLPILWELYPNHPNLLPAYFDAHGMQRFVKKPILSREGANIDLVDNGKLLQYSEGNYGREGYIFQELFELPCYDGKYPVIGSWVIAQQPAGIGIRESDTLITDNKSRFVPHLIDG
ncbi:glutathionylspermidine synthase [Chitinophaga niastensis]|uniref:Glutathionylspermidine synthase n=1 Tax=Chitinophaga niastensis TaxID=536980 RepID=A0A2P8HNZ9_CHINA|nr:glutathionylspermidine synthase family protein [Chitinophaga niastensis]PSL47944.1 glutathionylspermidine synthase [Chitinophaga niastensis]